MPYWDAVLGCRIGMPYRDAVLGCRIGCRRERDARTTLVLENAFRQVSKIINPKSKIQNLKSKGDGKLGASYRH
jgi:hypothetical protein